MPAGNDDLGQQFLAIRTRRSLAAFLGVPLSAITYLLFTSTKLYRSFSIRKASGSIRTIHAPVLPLKKMQRRLADALYAVHKPRACVFGYVEGRGIRENALLHARQRWVPRIDLKDFFPSINFG